LALLCLTLHDFNYSGSRASKGHEWDLLNRLHEEGWNSDPMPKSKSVVIMPEAIEESKQLFGQLFWKTRLT
jgi:hypothetical protein